MLAHRNLVSRRKGVERPSVYISFLVYLPRHDLDAHMGRAQSSLDIAFNFRICMTVGSTPLVFADFTLQRLGLTRRGSMIVESVNESLTLPADVLTVVLVKFHCCSEDCKPAHEKHSLPGHPKCPAV